MNKLELRKLPLTPPAFGETVELVPGILWLRMPLPTRLNHVNIYLFEDEDGWAVFDTGMADAECRAAWEKALSGVLAGRPITRLICSHFHLDHVGLAGWLHERFAPEFYMTQTEYLLARVLQGDGSLEGMHRQAKFFQRSGLDVATAETISRGRLGMRSLQTSLPGSFERLRAGDTLRLGGRDWRVLTGGGHSVEQIMLHSAADQIFISADQVLPEITPNISVGTLVPHDDPLGDFLKSLDQIKAEVSDSVVVMPGHRKPFSGLHARIAELEAHHHERCGVLLKACKRSALTGYGLVPVLFERDFGNDVVLASAIGEALAHVNFLLRSGALEADHRDDGVIAYKAVG